MRLAFPSPPADDAVKQQYLGLINLALDTTIQLCTATQMLDCHACMPSE